MNSILVSDILYLIRRHLPLIDRLEFSLVCKDLQEPHATIAREYVELGLRSIGANPNKYVCGYLSEMFVMWVVTNFTIAGEEKSSPTRANVYIWGFRNECGTLSQGLVERVTTIHPLTYIDRISPTDIHKVAYHRTHGLCVKNWNALLRRSSYVAPCFTDILTSYPFIREEDRSSFLAQNMRDTVIMFKRHLKITLTPCADIERMKEYFDGFLSKIFTMTTYANDGHWLFITKMIDCGYSLTPFLDETKADTN